MQDISDIDINNDSVVEFPDKPEKDGSPKTLETVSTHSEIRKFVRFPLSRIKHIMKMDPDSQLLSQDSIFVVTKATEMFLEFLAKESAKVTISSKRKTMMKKDVEYVIDTVPHLCFLDGAME